MPFLKKHWYILTIIAVILLAFTLNKGEDKEIEAYAESDGQLLIPQRNMAVATLELPGNGPTFATPKMLKKLAALHKQMMKLNGIKNVDSLMNASVISAEENDITIDRYIPEQVITDADRASLALLFSKSRDYPELAPYLSVDHRAAALYLNFGYKVPDHTIYVQLMSLRDSYQAEHGLSFQFTGLSPIKAETEKLLTRDIMFILPLLILMIILLFFYFKSTAVTSLSLLSLLLCGGTALAVIRLLDLPVPPLVILLPPFAIGLLSDYLFHYFYHLGGSSAAERASIVRRRLLVPLSLTALSSLIGFLSLSLIGGQGHVFLGISTAVMIAVCMGLVFVQLPRYAVVPTQHSRRMQRLIMGVNRVIFSLSYRLRYPLLVLIGTLVILATWKLSDIHLEPYPVRQLPSHSPISRSEEILTKNFAGTVPFFIEIDGGEASAFLKRSSLEKLQLIEDRLQSLPECSYTHSLLSVIKRINYYSHGGRPEAHILPNIQDDFGFEAMIEQYLLYYSGSVDPVEFESLKDASYRYASVRGILRYPSFREFTDFLAALEKLRDKLPGWQIRLHGPAAMLSVQSERIMNNWLYSLLVSLVLITLTVIIFYRRISLALMSLLPPLISMLLTGGLCGVTGIPVDIYTVIFIAVITGLVIDYTIHILSALARLPSEMKQSGEYDRISALADFESVMDYSGIPITLSFLSSAAAFICLLVSSFQGSVNIGILLIFSMSVSFFLSAYLIPLIRLSFRRK